MDAVDFIKTRARMCRKYDDCEDCILSDFCRHTCNKQDTYQVAEQAVANVLEWVKEHPVKTRQSELLKLFPEASVLYDEYLNICPAQISSECRDKKTGGCYDPGRDCGKCKRDFWLKEIE